MEENKIPQPDFFNINPDVSSKEKEPESLESRFKKERLEWRAKIESMSKQMKKVLEISDLMTTVYTERELCIEYYHYLISYLIKINKIYRKKYSERYDFWSFKSQIRYPSDQSKNNKILVEIADLVEQREIIENHSKFILSTCSVIDNIIYAIPKRIEIEQITRGK